MKGSVAMCWRVSILLIVLTWAATASAIVDPAPDHMGIYFDTSADVYEISSGPGLVPAYVVLTYPTFDSIDGYEFSYEILGSPLVARVDLAGENRIDLVAKEGRHRVQLPEPMEVGEATVLATVNLFVLDLRCVGLILGGLEPRTVDGMAYPAVRVDGALHPIGLPFGFDEAGQPQICAQLNCIIVDPVEEATWDQVKSLYR